MKEYNCPDCQRNDSCAGCPRTLQRTTNTQIEHIPPYFPDSITWPENWNGIPDCCKNCSNHPSNNGGKIVACNCTLPLLSPNSPYKITCSTSTSDTYYIG